MFRFSLKKQNKMSHFQLGNRNAKVRKKIKGIWLRKRPGCNLDVEEAIKKSNNLRLTERVWKIEIVELRKNNQVLLEIWATSTLDIIRNKERHNVFHILINQNPEWICEGDVGRGYKM